MVNAGIDIYAVGKVLGHSPGSAAITARYAHLDSESIARSPRMQLDFSSPVPDHGGPQRAKLKAV